MIGPTFGGYTQFPPQATAVLQPRGHPFYPQPILYWGYPSPPVSPTTYYGPPVPSQQQSPVIGGGNGGQTHHFGGAPQTHHHHQSTLVSSVV